MAYGNSVLLCKVFFINEQQIAQDAIREYPGTVFTLLLHWSSYIVKDAVRILRAAWIIEAGEPGSLRQIPVHRLMYTLWQHGGVDRCL